MSWLDWFKPKPPPPKWRLVPDDRGTYTLEKWHGGVLSMYLSECPWVTPEQADDKIKSLERTTKYYREDTEDKTP